MITINYIGYVTEKMQVQKKASYLERKKKKINVFPWKRRRNNNEQMGKVVGYRIRTNVQRVKPQRLCYKIVSGKPAQQIAVKGALVNICFQQKKANIMAPTIPGIILRSLFAQANVRHTFPVSAGILGSLLIWSTS